jgi:hypothetical protein
MLLELIVTLGVKTIFIENSLKYCGSNLDADCYDNDHKIIYLNLKDGTTNGIFYHELGHAIFWYSRHGFRQVIKDYPLTANSWLVYDEDWQAQAEKVADYFSRYMTDRQEFELQYPCLAIYFRDVLKYSYGWQDSQL